MLLPMIGKVANLGLRVGGGRDCGGVVGQRSATGPDAPQSVRFAQAKFRPTTLPTTLVTRPGLHGRLAAGASQRLAGGVGAAGAGKSLLLSSWAAARQPAVTSWLSGDEADPDSVR